MTLGFIFPLSWDQMKLQQTVQRIFRLHGLTFTILFLKVFSSKAEDSFKKNISSEEDWETIEWETMEETGETPFPRHFTFMLVTTCLTSRSIIYFFVVAKVS